MTCTVCSMLGHHPMIDLISFDSALSPPEAREVQHPCPADTRKGARRLLRAWSVQIALLWFGLGGLAACGEDRRIEFCHVELPPDRMGSCGLGGVGGASGGGGTGGTSAGLGGAGGVGGLLGLGGSGGGAGGLAGGGGSNGVPPEDAAAPAIVSDAGDSADAAVTP
jgi:hypothetical protein